MGKLATRRLPFGLLNRLLHYFDLDYPYINVIAAVAFFVGFHALAKRQSDPLGVLILAFPDSDFRTCNVYGPPGDCCGICLLRIQRLR